MTEETRRDLTPQGYIRRLFAETENGRITIPLILPDEKSEKVTHQVNWTEADADEIVLKYDLLTAALERIARLHDKLTDEAARKALLSPSDLAVWNTYVAPYEPFEVPLSVIEEIYERSRFGDLFEEEEALWKRYCMWREEESQKRIPFCRRSAADLILHARRYEKLVEMNAPAFIVTKAGRSLAEEMVLYYAGKEEPIVWE